MTKFVQKSLVETTGWIVDVALTACNYYGNMYCVSSPNSHFFAFQPSLGVYKVVFVVCQGNMANHGVDLCAQNSRNQILVLAIRQRRVRHHVFQHYIGCVPVYVPRNQF